MTKQSKILIYGYGNPGRQDDGLGIQLAEEIESWAKKKKLTNIMVDTNYQLNIEDAYNLTQYDFVFFADATIEAIQDFIIDEVIPTAKVEFTMHAVSPGFILNICKEMYGSAPKSYLLHIKGYEWEFMKQMSSQAISNLKKASNYLKKEIELTIAK